MVCHFKIYGLQDRHAIDNSFKLRDRLLCIEPVEFFTMTIERVLPRIIHYALDLIKQWILNRMEPPFSFNVDSFGLCTTQGRNFGGNLIRDSPLFFALFEECKRLRNFCIAE